MNTTLIHLETIVSKLLTADMYQSGYDQKFDVGALDIENLYTSVKDILLKRCAKKPSRKKMANLIQFYQKNFIRLIDELSRIECNSEKHCTLYQRYTASLIKNLTRIVEFLYRHYNEYFDESLSLPVVCKTKHQEIIEKCLPELRLSLQQHQLNDEFINVLLHPLTDFINQKQQSYTFHEKHFLYNWMHNLKKSNKLSYSIDDEQERFCRLIVASNVNSETCYDFLLRYITAQYMIEESKEEQLNKLQFYLKCIRQTTILHHNSYNYLKPSLQESLAKWVSLEISYIEDTCHINERIEMPIIKDSDEEKQKIKTNLSVPQLAAFLRISVEVGIYNEEQSKDLLRYHSKYFSTIGTDDISYDSLYNKFCSPKEIALETIKGTILKQLKIIQGNLF